MRVFEGICHTRLRQKKWGDRNKRIERNTYSMRTPNLPCLPHQHSPTYLLVERGCDLQQWVAELSKELSAIEKEIKKRVHCDFFDRNNDAGKTQVALGRGGECHIFNPVPHLKPEIRSTTPEYSEIKELCGKNYAQLFREVTVSQINIPEQFSNQVSSLFPADKAKRLLKLCMTSDAPVISWKKYKPIKKRKANS